MKKRIGIYGGSFNPIHNGHIQTAIGLINNDYVDEVRFMPTPQSPFKDNKDYADAAGRYNAIAMACNYVCNHLGNDRLHPDAFELARCTYGEPSYTVDTLKAYLSERSGDYFEFYFIMGMDTYNSLDKFKDYGWLLNSGEVKLLVIPRPGYEVTNETLRLHLAKNENVILVKGLNEINVSSTVIREYIKNGEWDKLNGLMPEPEINYLRYNNIYPTTSKESFITKNDNYQYVISLEILLDNGETFGSDDILAICKTREKAKEVISEYIRINNEANERAGIKVCPHKMTPSDAIVRYEDGEHHWFHWYMILPKQYFE